jgi:tRNA pseudouridine55 synthase
MITKIKFPINGILLLNKALNASSNKALQQVKRLYNAKKAGHTGSLDPLATGVLPLCFGEATKFSQYLLDADKIYTVWGRLGATTITGDAEGDVCVVPNAPIISRPMLESALKAFIGEIQQVPPMYSALKKDGVPLYTLARQGKEVERKARTITIYSIELRNYSEADFKIKVHCSKGTYIRTLVEDIGKYLNSGAYLLNLRRDKAGPYLLEHSYTLEQLESLEQHVLVDLLLPADTAVLNFSELYLSEEQTKMLQQGKQIYLENTDKIEKLVRLYHDTQFLGLGNLSAEGLLRVQRLVAV